MSEREQELSEMLEDLAGNLEDAADTIEKAVHAVMPGYISKDAEEYRRLAEKARAIL